MALRVFQTARAGLEATRGTNVVPTRILYDEEIGHEQEKMIIRSPVLRNSYFPVYSASGGQETNTITRSGRVSYDDLIWDANTHIKAVAAGTAGGTGEATAFTWDFTPTSATDDIKSATIQMGFGDTLATAPGLELGYCVGNEFTLTFSKDDDSAVRYSSSMMSPESAAQITAFTGTLSDRTVRVASAINTQTFIDTGTIGTTADTKVVSVEWTLTNGFVNLYTLNNSANAEGTFRPEHRTWTATIVRQYVNDSEWDAHLAPTVKKIRVRTQGDIIAGATTSRYRIDLDLYGVYTARSWGDVDGIITEELTLEPVYDTTAATDFKLSVVNATASIT